MTTFYSGLVVPPSTLENMATGLSYHNAGLIDSVEIKVNPIITPAGFSSETDISRAALSGNVTSGHVYGFSVNGVYLSSDTSSEWRLRLRHTTPVTGTFMGPLCRLGRTPSSGVGLGYHGWLVWQAPSTTTLNVFMSVQRVAGSGNLTLEGASTEYPRLDWYLLGSSGTIRQITT